MKRARENVLQRGESASPFIVEGDGLTSQRKREWIRGLPSLVAHAVGYEDDRRRPQYCLCQTHVAGSTVFAWYGKGRHLQYCLYSDTPGRLHSARLAWPSGTILKVYRACQGAILGIMVDLSALPYLLCLIHGPSPSGRLWSVILSWPRPCRSGKNHEQRPGVPPVEKGGRSRIMSPPCPGPLVGDEIILPVGR